MSTIILVRFARKPSDINEMKSALRDCERQAYKCEITETATLTSSEYDIFTRLMYKNWDWLDGKGGFRNNICQVIEVTAPERETLYVDPSGYSYARYVGLKIDANE